MGNEIVHSLCVPIYMCLVLSTQSKTKLLVIVSKFKLTYALTFYFTLNELFLHFQ